MCIPPALPAQAPVQLLPRTPPEQPPWQHPSCKLPLILGDAVRGYPGCGVQPPSVPAIYAWRMTRGHPAVVGTLALELDAVHSASRAHCRGKLLVGCCRGATCRDIMRSAEHQVQSSTATSGRCFHRRCEPGFGDARDDRASAQLRRRAVSQHVHNRGCHPINPPLVAPVRGGASSDCACPHGKLVRFKWSVLSVLLSQWVRVIRRRIESGKGQSQATEGPVHVWSRVVQSGRASVRVASPRTLRTWSTTEVRTSRVDPLRPWPIHVGAVFDWPLTKSALLSLQNCSSVRPLVFTVVSPCRGATMRRSGGTAGDD